jgi:hypothetical protein
MASEYQNFPPKQCSKCKTVKESQSFRWRNKTRTELQSYCKPCQNELGNEKNRAVKIRAVAHLGGKCTDCDRVDDPVIYDFDHLYDKKMDWSIMMKRSWERICEELAKCELVCSNCHRKRTKRRGT